MTRIKLGWQKFLLFTVLPCCWSLQVSIPEKQYKVAKGEDITLSCYFKPAVTIGKQFLLTWEAQPDDPGKPLRTVASYFIDNPVTIGDDYEDRVTMEVNVAGGTSTLHFTAVTMKDNRTFQCIVKIPNDAQGTTAASTFLLVLEAPSPPICNLQGKAEYFHDISLTCLSKEGSPPPAYTWTSYSIENNLRQFPPKTTQKDGLLYLFNISRETSGFFICTSVNEIGSAQCNFTLSVMPSGMNMGSTGIIIGGVVAAVVFVGILIFCFCRRKAKNNKYTEGFPEEVEFHEAGRRYSDDKFDDEKNKVGHFEDKAVVRGAEPRFDDDQRSSISGKEKYDGKGSDVGPQRYPDDRRDGYRGSRDHLEDQNKRYGSRDHLDDNRDRYGSRDRLDDNRDRYGSRDRLDDNRDRYGSRDRLDDRRVDYSGSRDRLDDPSDRYHRSRDDFNDRTDHYRGSRDRLDHSDDP